MSTVLQAILDHPAFPQQHSWWREDFEPGQVLVEENDHSRDLFMIESGVVRIDVDVEVTRRRHMQAGLLEMSMGEFFGELCLYGDVSRSASVVALTQGVVIHIDGILLAKFMDQHIELGYALLKEFFLRHSAALSDSNEHYSALYARQLLKDEGAF